MTRFFATFFALCATSTAFAVSAPHAPWTVAAQSALAALDARAPGRLGVYVEELGTGARVSLHGDEPWYLASGVKVPVAIATLRSVEDGELALEDTLVLEARDLVDGAGPTRSKPVGSALRVDWLIEQMLVRSDNTATDVLIRRIGLERVNAVARELGAARFGEITTLADVRRRAWSHVHPDARRLTGEDFLALKRARGAAARVAVFAQRLGLAPGALALDDLDRAFEAYYATLANSAPLSAYATLLAHLASGEALRPETTAYLLAVLERVETGTRRIRAGLPDGVAFAHKTGTQHRRTCDFGIARDARGSAAVIAACVRGGTLAANEALLGAVGAALRDAGLFRGPATGHAAP